MAAAGVVEADQVAGAVARARVEVGAHLADAVVAEDEPLRAAVETPLASLGVPPGHRPLDARLVALLDPVLERPPTLEVLDREARVLADRSCALVRAEARVVVDGVVGEVPGDEVGVAAVQSLVVGADVVEVADGGILTALSIRRPPVRR